MNNHCLLIDFFVCVCVGFFFFTAIVVVVCLSPLIYLVPRTIILLLSATAFTRNYSQDKVVLFKVNFLTPKKQIKEYSKACIIRRPHIKRATSMKWTLAQILLPSILALLLLLTLFFYSEGAQYL